MGPLTGIKVVELAGIGPGPFAAMLMGDLGADVLRIDRKEESHLGIKLPICNDLLQRNKKSIQLDLKDISDKNIALDIISKADVLIEGFRPGVAEKLGLGPDTCLLRNSKLVYGRMTGWGQEGVLSQTAGHDLNYLGLTGILSAIGRENSAPVPPLNLIGDYGGGSLYLVIGILAALMHAKKNGIGQVVDCAIVDGASHLATSLYGKHSAGMQLARGKNILDGGAPFYDSYACKDGKWLAVGPIETKFFKLFCEKLEIHPSLIQKRNDRERWEELRHEIRKKISTANRDDWCRIFEGIDACVSPVLEIDEAPHHPHMIERGTFIEIEGIIQPAPAPRFSVTPNSDPSPPQAANNSLIQKILDKW